MVKKAPAPKAGKKAGVAKRPAPQPAKRFRARGQRLWADLQKRVEGERGLVLLEEACRIADRLDELHAILKGDSRVWASIRDGRSGDLELSIDSALVEARQQANVLRQILVALPLEGGGDGDDDREAWVEEAGAV